MAELSWSAIQAVAERRIQEAIDDGEFDDLPGAGKPLRLEEGNDVPEDLRMAYTILKNAGCLPPELEDRREISRLVDMLEACVDERERVRQMQRLRVMVDRARTRTGRAVALEEHDLYYARILDRMASMDGKGRS
ncbi:MAG: DUF1992 domain-containing protein [Desulfovibrio sp.]|jgi:hypothetical protein|nr:DUF1992 domain-containing protein [Desulfovibrio sp.]